MIRRTKDWQIPYACVKLQLAPKLKDEQRRQEQLDTHARDLLGGSLGQQPELRGEDAIEDGEEDRYGGLQGAHEGDRNVGCAHCRSMVILGKMTREECEGERNEPSETRQAIAMAPTERDVRRIHLGSRFAASYVMANRDPGTRLSVACAPELANDNDGAIFLTTQSVSW